MADKKTMSQAEIDALLTASGQAAGTAARPTPAETAEADPHAEARPVAAANAKAQTAAVAEAEPAAAAKAAPPPSTPPEAPQAPQAPQAPRASVALEAVQSTVADLAERLAKIEAAMGALDQLQKTVTEANAIIRKKPQDLQSVANRLQDVTEQVEETARKLRSTPTYNIGEIFQCNSCDSEGLVAIQVKCTECGREKWWGWWPKE